MIKQMLLVTLAGILWFGISYCEPELSIPNERLQSTEARSYGKDLFLKHCSQCHGLKGDGRARVKAGHLFLRGHPPDFYSSNWRNKVSALKVFKTIRDGVKGTSMPSFGKLLSDEKKWDLTAYLLSIHEHGP